MARFYVRRTSDYGGGAQPIPGAIRTKVPVWDVRTFKSPEEHDARFPGTPWLSRGTEHAVIRGPRGGATGIRRRVEDSEGWSIELPDLEALIALVRNTGDIVVKSLDGRTNFPDEPIELEIYDTWRE